VWLFAVPGKYLREEIMQQIIAKIAELTPEVVDDTHTVVQGPETYNNSDDLKNYMFFRNLKCMKDCIEQMLKIDPCKVDSLISDGEDWAADHISCAAENIDHVYRWLKGCC
jgi:hypothetical protein